MEKHWVDKIFEVDRDNRVLTIRGVGGESLKRYKEYRCFHSNRETLEAFRMALGDVLGRTPAGTYGPLVKVNYEEFNKVVGTYPKRFRHIFNAIMKGLWVTPVEKYVQRYAFATIPKRLDTKCSKGEMTSYSTQGIGVVPHLVTRVWERKELLDQLEDDGLKTVQPFVFHSGKTPRELKKIMGKGLWKKVCKQSYTRNRACARMLGGRLGSNMASHHLDQLRVMLELPSKYLVRGGKNPVGYDEASLIYVRLEKSGEVPPVDYKGFSQRSRHLNVIGDTIRMAKRLGLNYNPEWPYSKWEEKHEEFTERVEMGRFSKQVFEWADEPWIVKQWEEVDTMTGTKLVFELLDNAYAIRKEGLEMHHCVSAYAHRSSTGDYMVYSVHRDGEKYSTLGLTVGDRVNRQQHYRHCNGAVDELANTLADRLVKQINKEKTANKETENGQAVI